MVFKCFVCFFINVSDACFIYLYTYVANVSFGYFKSRLSVAHVAIALG
jgi:hypothetical protein